MKSHGVQRLVAAIVAVLGCTTAVDRLSDQPSEVAATKAAASVEVKTVDAADVQALVHRGWHAAVQALVMKSHSGTEQDTQHTATQVRQAVQHERNRLDDLIRALDRNYGRAVDVNSAMQWAQNSTHVFLAVKFAQRWNAPGALEVANETFLAESCCVNFTAFGEHSMIKRRYLMSLELFQHLATEGSSWAPAAVGRISMVLKKAAPANWPRLTKAADTPKNLGIWRDMRDKWIADLEKIPQMDVRKKSRKTSATESGASKHRQKDDDQDDDALDKEVDLLAECEQSAFKGTSVAELCTEAWEGVVARPAVSGRRWLIEFYTSDGSGTLEAMRSLMPLWKRLADMFPSLVTKGRVAAVDCNGNRDLCKKLGATMLPQIRRFVDGNSQGEEWTGSLAASIEDFAAFGGDKHEL